MRTIWVLIPFVLISCAKYDSPGSYLALLALQSGNSVSVAPWAVPAFRYRNKIVFGTSHSALLNNHTVSVTFDSRTSGGQVQLASGNDVRIYWQPASGSAVELDRVGSTWNSATTSIDFRLQAALAQNLNEPADGSYYVYFGNASAGTPPINEMNVYYFADFFDRANSTTVGNGWTEWNGASRDMYIQSGALAETGNDQVMDAGVKQTFPLGPIPSDFTLRFDWGVVGVVQATWTQFVQIGDSTSMLNTNMTTGAGPSIYFGEGNGIVPDILYNMDYKFAAAGQLENTVLPNDAAAFQVLAIRLVVNTTAQTYNYYRNNTLIYSGATYENPVTNLNQIRIAMDNWGAGLTAYTYDNVRVSLSVADDPEMSLGALEIVP
ncbi:MAG: hypothetical protein K8S54_21275 [Spirochaetia bacterium]|nr:hypothetical protein [Spirochaetia bacterium]